MEAFAHLLDKSRHVEWLAMGENPMDRLQTVDKEPEGATILSSTQAKPARWSTTSEEKPRCGLCNITNAVC